ncbi:MAG: group I intron-associated PD-(D/E)XK endonuclease [Lentisphaeria bacterium]|jgi:predicted AAA+ superfamily ATPase
MDNNSKKQKARKLRIDERLSLEEISKRVGIAKSTASLWLRDMPLTKEERSIRNKIGAQFSRIHLRKDRGEESKYYLMASKTRAASNHKGRISESAVAFRLSLIGLTFYMSPFDGDHVDFIVENSNGKHLKIQVRSTRRTHDTMPMVRIKRYCGNRKMRKYERNDCDILVAYDLKTDVAYVFTYNELNNRTSHITMCPEAAEKWDKLEIA